MEHKECNRQIQCTVSSCVHHDRPHNCCTLEAIQVGCCDCIPTQCAGTECASFRLGETQ